MSERRDQTLEAIRAEQRLIAVQDDDLQPYLNALHELTGSQKNCPLFVWDDAGLRSQTYSDDLPESTALSSAFDFVRKFPGEAVFLFDCRDVDMAGQIESVGRRLAAISDKVALDEDCLVVLLVSEPLPEVLARRVHWIGDPARITPSEKAKTPRRKSSSQLAGIGELKTFDTPEWYDRISSMTHDEIQEVVTTAAYQDSLDRLNALRDELKQRFAQKDEILDAMFAAAVAQVPSVLMGPPGTAKGHMIRSICEGLGLAAADGKSESRQYFEYQLTRFTTPEEVFGPVHIQQLIEKQSYRRVTDGYLPKAQVAFLDEIFKASSAILNTLLSLLNERVFYNEGRPEKVPLTTIFAASNEPPQDESLTALFDRFPIRINCPAVDDEKLGELLEREWDDAFEREFGTARTAIPQLACTNDLRLLHKVSRAMFGGRQTGTSDVGAGDFRGEFLRCFRALRGEAGISDRSLGSLYTFARASAMLSGRKAMNADDLEVFRFVRWDPSGELDRFVRNLKRTWRG